MSDRLLCECGEDITETDQYMVNDAAACGSCWRAAGSPSADETVWISVADDGYHAPSISEISERELDLVNNGRLFGSPCYEVPRSVLERYLTAQAEASNAEQALLDAADSISPR